MSYYPGGTVITRRCRLLVLNYPGRLSVRIINLQIRFRVKHAEPKLRTKTSLERVCRGLVWDPGSDEVRVADGLYLVHSILVDEEVKQSVETVQEYHDLDSSSIEFTFSTLWSRHKNTAWII